jgi:hypothetical protein
MVLWRWQIIWCALLFLQRGRRVGAQLLQAVEQPGCGVNIEYDRAACE